MTRNSQLPQPTAVLSGRSFGADANGAGRVGGDEAFSVDGIVN